MKNGAWIRICILLESDIAKTFELFRNRIRNTENDIACVVDPDDFWPDPDPDPN
jgi:hypothetical protein